MSTHQYYDYEPFAERIAQVITGNLTEDELKTDFPEIDYFKVGDVVGKNTVSEISKFMITNRILYEVARVNDNTSLMVIKVANFGDAPTPLEEFESKTAKRNALVSQLAEYQQDGTVLINPETFEPYEDTEEGRAERAEYLGAIAESIRVLDTDLSALKAIL